MEEELQEQVTTLVSEPGVVGAVCLNRQGLVLCKEGNVADSLVYSISLLAKHASSLGDTGPVPVTCVEFNSHKILVKQTEKVVFAVISEAA